MKYLVFITTLFIAHVVSANSQPPFSLSWGQHIQDSQMTSNCYTNSSTLFVRCSIKTNYFNQYNPEVSGYFHKEHGLQVIEVRFSNISSVEKITIENELFHTFGAVAEQSIFKSNQLVLEFYNKNYNKTLLNDY